MIVETGSTAREPLRIVLLEDNPADARLVQESLRDCDTRIDCDIAAELWQVSPERLALADCALIDLGLPDATDMEAVQWIRDLAPQLPIVVLTGFDDEVTGLAALQKGAQDFLVKQHADGYLIARAIRFAVGPNAPAIRARRSGGTHLRPPARDCPAPLRHLFGDEIHRRMGTATLGRRAHP